MSQLTIKEFLDPEKFLSRKNVPISFKRPRVQWVHATNVPWCKRKYKLVDPSISLVDSLDDFERALFGEL